MTKINVKESTKPTPKPVKGVLSTLSRASIAGLINIEKASYSLGIDRRKTAIKLASLARRGWLSRVKRGLYYVVPLDTQDASSAVIHDPWILASVAFDPCYIGGWSTAEHWNLTEQLFRLTFVVTNQSVRSMKTKLLGVDFRLVRVPKKRLEGVTSVWRGSVRVPVSSPERTIVDALQNPEWLGGLRHVVDVLRNYREEHSDLKPLRVETLKAKKGVVFKRLGFLLENLWPNEKTFIAFCRARITKGYVKLDPTVKARGRLVRRWGLWVNIKI